mgnify:CR=1 FL=1
MPNLLPNHLRINPFRGDLSDEQFQAIFAQHICYGVLDEKAVIAITDSKGIIRYANHAFVQLSQYTLAELIGQDHRILNSGYHPRGFFKAMYRDIANGKKWRAEIRNRAKDGSFYWVDTSIVPIIGERAKILGYASIRLDITARKIAEEAQRASEERFRDLTASASDWFWEQDAAHRFTNVSSGISRAGLTPALFVGKSLWEMPADGESLTISEHRAAVEAQRPFKEMIVRVPTTGGDASWLSLSGKPRFDENGAFVGFRGVGRCITTQFLAQKTVRQQADLLQAIKHNFPGGFAVVSKELRVVESNSQFRNLLDLPEQLFENGPPRIEDLLRLHAERGDLGTGDVDEIVAGRLELMRLERAQVYELAKADGTILEVRSAPLKGGGWVKTFIDITERRRSEEKVRHLAEHDALTGLANRRLLRRRIRDELAGIAGRDEGFALLLLDLDQFKKVNDTFGHPTGDELLTQVSQRLKHCVREKDMIARLGGDEFAVVLTDARTSEAAATFAQRIIDILCEPFLIDGRKLTVGVSVGIAMAPKDGRSADQLFKKADIALYRAKANGRRTYCAFAAEFQAEVGKRVSLEQELREAIERDELRLHFQPQIDLRTNRISAFEALVRWNHPSRGIVPPQMFIPIAEEAGLIHAIGSWALRTACRTAANWPAGIKVAVNVSPVQLCDAGFLRQVGAVLEQSGVSSDRLEIEITESTVMQAVESKRAVLGALKELGVALAMDDFGTGYSSLTSLQNFHFDKIKIDRSFISRLANSPRDLALFRAVVSLGKALGIATTAEGVETRRQLAIVRNEGCSEAQGFLLGRPRPISAYAGLIAAAAPNPGALGGEASAWKSKQAFNITEAA